MVSTKGDKMISRVCNRSSQDSAAPPDVNNPPSYIPLRSIEDRYQIVEELGNGSFGCVSLAKAQIDLGKINEPRGSGLKPSFYRNTLLNQEKMEHENFFSKSQRLVAIKTMMTKLPTLHDYTRVREIKFILSIPAHKHLIQIFEIFIDSQHYQLHIVMECMEQNLYQMMRHRRRRVFSIPSLKSILAQILAGLKHIHEHDFFHRDLKPENILISASTRYFDKKWLNDGKYTDNYIVKLADFGLARHVQNKNPYTAYVSTRWYRSPEILLRSGYYSTPLDIWAFGCVAVEVTIFKPLFPGSNEMDQIWKILEILGTPHKTDESILSNYISHGGSWENAKEFAQRLNMKFPYIEGSGLDSLISSSQLKNLIEVIKLCLKWDPDERADVSQLCSMEFFHDTILDEREPSIKRSKNNIEPTLIFAGVKSSTSSNKNSLNHHSRKLIFHSENLLKHQQAHQVHSLNNENETGSVAENENENENNNNDDIIINDAKNQREDNDEKRSSFDKIVNINPMNDINRNDSNDELLSNHNHRRHDDDEIDISKEIAENIALCQIPIFENGQFLQQSNIDFDLNDKSLKNLANEIDTFDEQNPVDSFSQYYSTTTNSNVIVNTMTIPIESNYVHHHHSHHGPRTDRDTSVLNNCNSNDISTLQPVKKLLDNMSIDDSFNTNVNNQYSNVIPRSFLSKEQMTEETNKQLLELERGNIQYQQNDHQNQNMNESSNYSQKHQEQVYFGNVTF
ncbi:hypothetical protein HG535_0H00910 [Zygotorulaspora mrakii]|uniref:Protein kinase domain-containing protein n=1 Tax=Zygotorulaspora mrakii TaxID=42260 RepID=A0A7H9B7W6_ZYGMR|nr:uncharacterized protein HG535_0H00910 [Zygotorulaspora mrakii]QLG74765.1 hypothetical protein HG535_0H00910 [Zygotorulaspora mrakii]